MTKPTIVQRKDIKPEKDITGLETPTKSQEVSVVIRDAHPKQRVCVKYKQHTIISYYIRLE